MKAKVLRKLSGSLIGCQAKKTADKVDDITSLMASKAIVALIHLHGWMLVLMEWATGHAVPTDL